MSWENLILIGHFFEQFSTCIYSFYFIYFLHLSLFHFILANLYFFTLNFLLISLIYKFWSRVGHTFVAFTSRHPLQMCLKIFIQTTILYYIAQVLCITVIWPNIEKCDYWFWTSIFPARGWRPAWVFSHYFLLASLSLSDFYIFLPFMVSTQTLPFLFFRQARTSLYVSRHFSSH